MHYRLAGRTIDGRIVKILFTCLNKYIILKNSNNIGNKFVLINTYERFVIFSKKPVFSGLFYNK